MSDQKSKSEIGMASVAVHKAIDEYLRVRGMARQPDREEIAAKVCALLRVMADTIPPVAKVSA